ncbi:MAG: hypothetical protein Q8R12_05355, partial [bacterium]|nr:hypothetical protein [bacterium]
LSRDVVFRIPMEERLQKWLKTGEGISLFVNNGSRGRKLYFSVTKKTATRYLPGLLRKFNKELKRKKKKGLE